ncbi:hypothetical protein CIN_04330 [Commensalibacter intestini A911]|uniref:Uncharacterized protein n=2 Tax=Commensalibacter intestini TaxID=479936 RepID=A0A251ZVX2_9PROT|nr:hypothetical protein [Commensalibacter intestini]EHD14501.1 hypothetical protein CIN_04330 [Commensalibacter intestini A911]OUI78820.1 hypothetical protein HK18_05280 [Commensalibacter intestini]
MLDEDDEREYGLKEKYEYELPGEPLNPSGEPLGKVLFTNPSVVPSDIKPLSDKEFTGLGYLKYWLLSCIIMLIFGLTFEFGILGKDGKEGPLCQYLPQNKMCYYLAGVAPTTSGKPAPFSVK